MRMKNSWISMPNLPTYIHRLKLTSPPSSQKDHHVHEAPNARPRTTSSFINLHP